MDIGIPILADGIPLPNCKNELQNTIQTSINQHTIKEKMKQAEYQTKKNADIEHIFEMVVDALNRKQVENGYVTIKIRLKYHHSGSHPNSLYNDLGELFSTMSDMFSTRLWLKLKSIDIRRHYIIGFGSGEECCCGCIQSLVCCIPLFFWIPHWYKDEKYGELYNVQVQFDGQQVSL